MTKLWVVSGQVQGVGFRYFVQRAASLLNLKGYVRNLDDGTLEVHATGTPAQLSELAGQLRIGPRFSEVRGVKECEAVPANHVDFRIT